MSSGNYISSSTNWSQSLKQLIESHSFQGFIVTLIVINAILLGMETSTNLMANYGDAIAIIDNIILTVFVLEIIVRLYVYRLKFWRDPWSVFDFCVVFIALVPATGPFAIVRALRVLRVLRLLTMIPSMQRVVGALLSAIPGLSSIAFVLLIFYYVTAVMATHFFSAAYPEWFGNLGRSLYTLFQIMTLESWSMGISRPVMEQFPYAWAFFIPFILIATFTMLNLFIAIIVNAMQRYTSEEREETATIIHESQEHIETSLHEEVVQLRAELKVIKQLLLETRDNQTSAPK